MENILKDLSRYGWETRQLSRSKLVLELDTSIEPQTICINDSGIDFYNVRNLTNEENSLVQKLKSYWQMIKNYERIY